jgi:hypothetical protein
MQILLGLIPLALLGGGDDHSHDHPPGQDDSVPQWEKDICIHRPGLQCTAIRGTDKFDLHNDRYTSGAIFVNIANYLREEIGATPLDGDLYGASATYEIALDDGAYTRPRDFMDDTVKVPGLGVPSDHLKYEVKCGQQEWAKRLELCTFHIEEAPFSLNPLEANESVALGNFPMPDHYKLNPHFNHAPTSFYSSRLNMLFVLFPISNASSTRALELIRLPILKEDSKHWDGRMEALNGVMGRNFSLCSKPPCTTGSAYRHMTATTFNLEHMGGVTLSEDHQEFIVYDDHQIVGLRSTSVDVDHVGPAHAECCDTSGRVVPNCVNMAYFRFGKPCDGGKAGDPDCTEAGQRGLLPLPNLGSLTTLVDSRYAPAMIYTCSSDGAGGINVTASNVANIPDPYCAPLHGRKPADCMEFEHKPSFRLFHLPAANITLDPFLEETPAGVPVWSIVLIVIFGCLVLAVAVALPLWWLLNQMKKHKYQTVA